MMRFFIFSLLFLCLLPVSVSAQFLTGYGGYPQTEVSSKPEYQPQLRPLIPQSEYQPQLTPLIPQPEVIVQPEPIAQGAPVASANPSGAPVDLQADNVSYDEAAEIVTATGNVIIVQEGRILRADEVRYNVNKDVVEATGNVVLNEVNGDIHFSQYVELQDGLKNGFVEGLESTLTDGSYFTALKGKRKNGNKTILSDGAYTPCEVCRESGDEPAWQIRASKVTHDEEAAQIKYNHARFEVYGVPIAYSPYFAHSDGSVERKSGFLAPSIGYTSELGGFVENSYYWNIAPDKDLTLGVNAYTNEDPLGVAEYRQRWENASLILNGGVTHSERIDDINGVSVLQPEETRGFVFGEGLWNIDDKWRSGFKVEYASDDQFVRQYDITNEDVFENELFVERFSGRNYARGVVQAFQDLRVSSLESDQPEVLPEINVGFIGEPGDIPLIKGRWDIQGNFLSLFRDGSGQDLTRASLDAGWERRFVSDYGLVANIDASLRGDVFRLNDRDVAELTAGRSGAATETRFFPQINGEASYPVARAFEKSQIIIEPLVSLTAAPRVDEDDVFPNEDSQDVQLDSSNLFEANRFPGLDLVEDDSRVTYGVRSGLHGFDGSYLEGFIGQSYRFSDDDIPFAAGSGLEQQSSDIVGYLNGEYENTYSFGYRFQLDNESLAAQRHELDARADWNRFRLHGSYLFARPLAGTEITETREQLNMNAQYYINKAWRLRSGATQDLGEDEGLRQAYAGIDYYGCCVFWSLTGVRNLTSDSSGDSSTAVLFRIGLKNLGEFERSGLRATRSTE